MEVEITYTDVNGVASHLFASSPEEAIQTLSAIPGYARRPMDDVAESFVGKMKSSSGVSG